VVNFRLARFPQADAESAFVHFGSTASSPSRRDRAHTTKPSRGPAADGMPALAITDLATCSEWSRFYKAARRGGSEARHRRRRLDHQRIRARQAAPAPAARAVAPGLSQIVGAAHARLARNQHRGRAELKKSWFAEGTEGLIVLSGAAQGDVGAWLLQDRARAEQLAETGAAFSRAVYLELQVRGAADEAYVEAAVRLAEAAPFRWSATHPVQFLKPGDSPPTKRAYASVSSNMTTFFSSSSRMSAESS